MMMLMMMMMMMMMMKTNGGGIEKENRSKWKIGVSGRERG
jgi:hypothetical protein